MEKPRRRVRAQNRQQHSVPISNSAQPLFNKHQTRHDNTINNNDDARNGHACRVRVARSAFISVGNGMVYLRSIQKRREEEKGIDFGDGKRWR